MGCGGSKPEGGSGSQRQQPPHLWVGEVRKFTFTSNGKRYGMRLGALGDRVHDPYRCNGGGIEGEYGQATQLVVCSPEKATTLFWSQQYPHVNKLLINYQRHRCINVHWWKLVEGTACSIYDAYPTGPATGQKWIINSDGSISQHEERHLVLGLANHHSGWDVVKLVKAGAPSAILLDSPAPAAAFEGKLDGEWVGDYHEYGKERVRIDYVASESGTTICATKITGDHIVAAGMVTWEVPMGSTKGRANCGQHGWCDGDLIIRGPDHIAFRWSIWKTVEYKRAATSSGKIEDLGCFTGGPRLNHGSAALGWKYHSNDEIARCFQDRFLPELQCNGGVGYFGIECGGEIFWCFEKDRHRLSEGGRHRKGDHGNHHTGRNHQNIRIPGFSGAINHIGGDCELQIHKVTLGALARIF